MTLHLERFLQALDVVLSRRITQPSAVPHLIHSSAALLHPHRNMTCEIEISRDSVLLVLTPKEK